MRLFLIQLRAELRNLYFSPATYIAAFLFVLLMGLLFQWGVNSFLQSTQEVPPWVLFFQGAFWVPVCIMVPLLTMRSLAEEKKLGTLESLLATSISPTQIVSAKFFAAYLFYLFLWSLTLVFNGVLYHLTESPLLWETGPIVGGLLFTAVSGLLFIAVGIFASALTRSQLVAGIFSFSILFFIIFGTWFAARLPLTDIAYGQQLIGFVEYFQLFQHAEDFGQGVIDTRPLLLYVSVAFTLFAASVMMVDSKLWRS